MIPRIKQSRFFAVFVFLFLILWGNVQNSWAEENQENTTEEKKVKAVQIQQNQRVSTPIILAKIRTKTGEPFSKIILNEDVKRLYGTGFFNDVKVDLKDQEDGIVVTFLVLEKPVLKKIHFKGNKVFRNKK